MKNFVLKCSSDFVPNLENKFFSRCIRWHATLMHELVSWCFEPSQRQRITSGLNTNFTLSPSYSFHKSVYHKSFERTYIPRAFNTGTCLWQGDLFYSAGLHRNHVLATADTGKIGRGFGKNAGEWTGRVEISKEEIPGSKRSLYGYIQTCPRL